MRKIHDDVRRLGAGVLIVSFAPSPRLRLFLAEQPQPFPIVSDPTLAAYRAFGLERTPARRLFRPDVLLRFVRLICRGWLPLKPAAGDDVLQLGGDFVLDAAGVLRFAHPSAEPTDRPTAAEMIQQIRKWGA